ncbi:polymorphic toxin-type HINT domain-containing protein [Paenibacillus thiaminolyticus]|uniref:polymorphic toxin-type HINT domain-containing protein n=1 Tax=Paenibacillus thiaminolyticus TaxID=49283 RepID=UPI0035A5CF4A
MAKAGCNCFTAGTQVLTDEGEKPIEEIEVGDKVLAKDDETGELAYKEVEWLFQRDVEETYNITVGGEVITTTDEHPFWIVGKGWMESKDLVVGAILTTSDGKELAIEKIEVKKEHKTVYNFKVKDFHTYFVSNLGIWTHNSCGININKLVGSSTFEAKKAGTLLYGKSGNYKAALKDFNNLGLSGVKDIPNGKVGYWKDESGKIIRTINVRSVSTDKNSSATIEIYDSIAGNSTKIRYRE